MDDSEQWCRHLLTTNHEPSELEIPKLRKIIAERETSIAQLNAQIAKAQRVLNALVKRRRCEHDLLCLYRGIVSPIRRLPRDILSEIFYFMRTREPDAFTRVLQPSAFGRRFGQSPVRITHVCSEWRTVALAMPILWSKIIASCKVYDSPNSEWTPSLDERLQTWLARAGTHVPLDITFECKAMDKHLSSSRRISPLSWILPYRPRVTNLSLGGEFDELPGGCFDRLEMLWLSTACVRSWLSSLSAPSLRRLRMSGEFFPFPFIPWQQLTHLCLKTHRMDTSLLFQTIRQSRALVKLEITCNSHPQFAEFPSVDVADDARFIMAHLETLSLIWPAEEAWLIPYLILPALTELQLSSWSLSEYHSLQSRSLFRLKSFRYLHWNDTTDSDILDLLSNTPSLTDAIFDMVDLSSMLVDRLSWNPLDSSPNLAPNLEYIAFHTRHSVDDDEILTMVASRIPSGKARVLDTYLFSSSTIFRSHLPKKSQDDVKLKKFAFKKDEFDYPNDSDSKNICFGEHVHIFF